MSLKSEIFSQFLQRRKGTYLFRMIRENAFIHFCTAIPARHVLSMGILFKVTLKFSTIMNSLKTDISRKLYKAQNLEVFLLIKYLTI